MIAGDFNDNAGWDRGERATNWAATVKRYREVGLVSAYHEYFGEVQGDESTPTLYWQSRRADGPRYHIDYCFIPEGWLPALRSVSVGSYADWVAPGLSDHVPLVVDLDLEQLARPSRNSRGSVHLVRDWSDLHRVLAVIAPGEWTTYSDLAEVIGSAARPVGQHIAACDECPNAYRVLGAGGIPAANFRWSDLMDTRDPRAVLEGEGLAFPAGVADVAKRVRAGALRARLAGG